MVDRMFRDIKGYAWRVTIASAYNPYNTAPPYMIRERARAVM